MDKCTQDVTLPRHEAVASILARCEFEPRTEMLPCTEAYGRVLACNVYSENDLPNHLASNRDGVAFYYDRYVACGGDTSSWKHGVDWEYSNTGIGISGDFDTVLLIEHVSLDNQGRISFDMSPAERGVNTIPVGKELQRGELIARRGQALTPSVAALLAKGGHTCADVVRPPVVSFIPTGNELVPPDAELPARKNVDANSTLIRGKLSEAGAEGHIYPIVRDDRDALRAALADAIAKSDIVIINGGSSKGTDDNSHEVLAELGEVLNHQVDTGPGKHTSYSVVKGKPVIGLSGPTVCCDYTFDWYVRPLIDRFLGRPDTVFPTIRAKMLCPVRFTRKGVTFMMGSHVWLRDGEPVVMPAANIDDERTLEGKVNGFVALRQGFSAEPGDPVEVELRYPFAMPREERLDNLLKSGEFVF
jgi:molybdopterin molybdotransferase